MKFEVAGQRKAMDVELETEPRRFAAGAAVGEHAARLRRYVGGAGLGSQIAAGRDKGVGEPGVEGVTAEAEGGRGELLDADESRAVIPCDLAMGTGVGEHQRKLKTVDRGRRKAGDKVAADAMARVTAGVEKRDGHFRPAESEAEGQSGEATPDNLNGPG
jgi:hypothetical protein